MNFRNYLILAEQFTVQRYAAKGEGFYFGLKIGRKRVGHVGGIERQTNRRNDQGQLVPDHYFDVMNVSLDEDQRGKGWFQPALQQIADMFPNGIRSAKVQTSRAFAKAMMKMPTYSDTEREHVVSPSNV